MANVFTDTTALALYIEKALDAQAKFALRAAPIFRPLIDFRPGVLTNPGQPVKLTIDPYIALQKTTLPESSDPDTVPMGAPTVVNVSPLEKGMSTVTTVRLTDLAYSDVAMRRGIIVGRNMIDTLDDLVKDIYDSGTNITTQEGTAAGSLKFTGNVVNNITQASILTGDAVATTVARLRARNVAPKVGEDFVAVAHPHVTRDLMREGVTASSWFYTHANGGDTAAIYNGEVGRYLGARFVESPKVNKITNANATPASVYTTYFLGQEAVVEHVVTEPRIVVGNIGRDSFGRFFHVGWYGHLGWSLYRPEPLELVKTSATIQ
jgi:N4-gp56 family major capsid protein